MPILGARDKGSRALLASPAVVRPMANCETCFDVFECIGEPQESCWPLENPPIPRMDVPSERTKLAIPLHLTQSYEDSANHRGHLVLTQSFHGRTYCPRIRSARENLLEAEPSKRLLE